MNSIPSYVFSDVLYVLAFGFFLVALAGTYAIFQWGFLLRETRKKQAKPTKTACACEHACGGLGDK